MKTSFKVLGTAWLLRWCGALLARAGHASLAAQLFRTADSLSLADLPHFAYARALWQDRQYEDAKITLLKILAHTPEHAEANNLLGVLFFEEDKMELAGQHFRRAIVARPDFAAPRNNLGNIHRANQELEEAARCYRAALGCDPDYVEALTNLGIVLNLQGDNTAAENYCRKAVELAPEFAGAHCNLGNVLLSLGRGGEAVAAFREALRLQPGLFEALVNLALVLEDSGYLVGTIDYYEKQLQRQPGNYLPHVRIAQALQGLQRWEEARLRLAHALELKPEAAEALFVLGVNYVHVGDARAGVDCMRRVLYGGPNIMAQMGIAFNSLYLEDCSGEQLCAEFRDWAEQYVSRPRSVLSPRGTAQIERRLRIGYVSRDFARHSVAYFLEPILKHHDRSRVEVFCYSTLIRGDDFTDRFRALADAWRDISTLSEDKVVGLVKKDEIDILVDLSGHTVGSRLGVFACKPAPVEITYLGHPTTTGIAAIDYRFGDAVADPAELTAGHYVERLWQLPGCFLTYQPPTDAPLVAQPPLAAKGRITFGSFNNAAKINDRVIAVWAEILAAIPSSRLLLKSSAFASSHGRARLVDGFSCHGITPDRLELVDWRTDMQNHLELYGEIDIALDPFPYNGTTTTCEALWMGVPVICLEGDRHSGRVGASLLNAVGLDELLASNVQDYIDKTIDLANSPDRLIVLRQEMRDRMKASPLLDHAGFARKLEDAYDEMWRDYCEKSFKGHSGAVDYQQQKVTGCAHESTITHSGAVDHQQQKDIELPLAGCARIVVPDSLDVITRYVLEEQGDWFEEEIRFARKFLTTGMHVVDVGANYGTYSLSAAAAVGASGAVWAFEPSASVAAYLQRSVSINDFKNLTVIERAVSDFIGESSFAEENNSELSRLVIAGDKEESSKQVLQVPVTTLDHCREEFGWGAIDFVKIDAEGSEPSVVRGGRRFLTGDQPLVMAEFKHGTEYNQTIVEEFSAIGFEPYRLVRGVMVLTSFKMDEPIDPYLLNLFFCSREKAALLEKRGVLATDDPIDDIKCPQTYEQVLHLHQSSLRSDLTANERLACLRQALIGMEVLMPQAPSLPARLTLARLLFDFGYQDRAREEYDRILKELLGEEVVLGNEPLLLPSGPFESKDCGDNLHQWLTVAVAEWLATFSAYSSYFSPLDSLRYLRIAHKTGLHCEDISRRIGLVLRRI